jgi:hypothetical protein
VLLTASKWRVSFSGSLVLLGFTLALFGASVHTLVHKPVTKGALLGVLVCGALCLFVVGQFRFASIKSNGRLFVRTLFDGSGVEARACALGVSVTVSAKGGTTYTVYATDGTSSAQLAECWTKRGAARAQRRLEHCFGTAFDDPARSAARARVDAAQQRSDANFAAAQRHVDAYYASGAFRRTAYLMIGIVALYLVGLCLYAWLTGARL